MKFEGKLGLTKSSERYLPGNQVIHLLLVGKIMVQVTTQNWVSSL